MSKPDAGSKPANTSPTEGDLRVLCDKVERNLALTKEGGETVQFMMLAQAYSELGLAARTAMPKLLDEVDRLRRLAEDVVFHYFNCQNDCPKARGAVAALAEEVGYHDNPATDEEIAEALAEYRQIEEEEREHAK